VHEGIDLRIPEPHCHEGFSVIQADTDELRDCVYRLRYYVYVMIMKRKQVYADHARRIICEPMDEIGISYLAIKNGQMIGTVRRNLLKDETASYYASFYQAELFETVHSDRLAMTTKLMMLPEYQGTRQSLQFINDYASNCYEGGIAVDLIDCNEHLIPFFERLGYFGHTGWAIHKEYGRVLPMFFASDAVRYLELIRSPWASIASKYVKDDQYGGYTLIRRLAQLPMLEPIRSASAQYRAQLNRAAVEAAE
jgi:hypothetical protein